MSEENDHYLLKLEEKRLVIVPISVVSSTSSELVQLEIKGKTLKGKILHKGSKQQCLRRAQMIQFFSKATAAINDAIPDNETTTEDNNDESENCEDRQEMIVRLLFSFLSAIAQNGNDTDDIHSASCDGCNRSRIRGDRYKCLECHNYDLCGYCFERGRESSTHKSGHVFAHFKLPGVLFGESVNDVNQEITLDALRQRFANEQHGSRSQCGVCRNNIVGLRFQCDVCHHFSLCFTCLEKKATTDTHLSTHSLIAIGKEALQEISSDDIKFDEELARGRFGVVYKAKWLSKNLDVACKLISVSEYQEQAEISENTFKKELAAYAELSGPYILKTYGYGEKLLINGNKQFLLITEYMSRGSLRHVFENETLSIRRKLDMACDIASGMRKLHAHQIIHRDIRPDNILVSHSYQAKLGDMGVIKQNQLVATLAHPIFHKYMPYEFYEKNYDQSLDIFMFGLTLNEFFTKNDHNLYINKTMSYVKMVPKEESPVFKELFERCLRRDPKQRPSAIEIEKTLCLYRDACSKLVTMKYIRMSNEEKNEVFLEFYNEFHPQAKEALAKLFPPAPPPEEDQEEWSLLPDPMKALEYISVTAEMRT